MVSRRQQGTQSGRLMAAGHRYSLATFTGEIVSLRRQHVLEYTEDARHFPWVSAREKASASYADFGFVLTKVSGRLVSVVT